MLLIPLACITLYSMLKCTPEQGWPWLHTNCHSKSWHQWIHLCKTKPWRSPASIGETLQINKTLKGTLLSEQFSSSSILSGMLIHLYQNKNSFTYTDIKLKSWSFQIAFNTVNTSSNLVFKLNPEQNRNKHSKLSQSAGINRHTCQYDC